MSFTVVLTNDAARDVEDLYAYVIVHDGRNQADRLLEGLESTLAKLSDFPHRGESPPELAELGIKQFRQVHYKPSRAIYQVLDTTAVVVMLIADGRRDMRSLLERRLLG